MKPQEVIDIACKCENGLVYAWKDSCTSWTVLHDNEVTAWPYAKLEESNER